MDFKVVFSAQALGGLRVIIDYVAQDNADAVNRLARSLIDQVRILQVFPHAGVLVPKRPGVRKLFHTLYKIYYRIHARRKAIEVLNFWHGARLEPPTNSN